MFQEPNPTVMPEQVQVAPNQETDRPGWLMWRKGGIGGSDAAAILGEDPYATPLDVYADKTSEFVSDEESLACSRGLALEPLVAQRYAEETGKRVRKQPSRVHPEHEFIRCSMDYQVYADDERPTGLLECKTANAWVFNNIKLNGIPMKYWIQVQHNMMVCGYGWAAIAVLQPDSWQFIHFPIERDDEFCATLLEREIEFWQLVTDRTPPAIEAPAPVKMPKVNGDLVKVEDLDAQLVTEFHDRVDAYSRIKEIADEAGAVLSDHKESLQQWMLDNGFDVIEGFGKRIYYKEQAGRKSFDKKALAAAHPEIDLSAFEKSGNPFRTFKVYDRPLQIEGGAS